MKKKWSSQNNEDLLSLVEEHYKRDQDCKRQLAKTWEEVIRFIEGDQFIRYNKSARAYEPIPDRIDGEYVPRANDNQLYLRADILRSNLTRQTPIFNVTPNSSDPKDERLAKVALAVHDARTEIDEDIEKRGECADWAVSTGNAFLKVGWVPTKKIPKIDPNGEHMRDEQGNIIMVSLGDVETTVPSPLQIAPDEVANIRDATVMQQYSIQNLDDVKEWYGFKDDNYTGEAFNLGAEEIDESNILKIEQDLMDYMGKDRKSLKECVILKETYVKPSEELKSGAMIIVANGKVLYRGPSPYALCDPNKWHPYQHFKYKPQPGKFWGITPLAQCVKIQRSINAIDTILILHRQTVGLGQWLIPTGSIKDGAISGRVGLKIQYKSGPKGEKPEKIQGTAIGGDIYQERMTRIAAMDAICGTQDILQGKPGDLTSGIALETVREQAFSRFNPMYERWEKFNEKYAQLRLGLIAKNQSLDIPEFTSLLRNKLRNLTGLDVQQFVGASLEDNTNIRITAGSTIPKTTSAKLAFLREFGEAGLLGDLVQDPMKNQLFLNAFSIDNFKTTTNVDFEKSKYELGQIEYGEQPQVHPKDNHALHNQYFESKLKDPEWYTSRSPEVVQAAWAHYDEHEKAMQDEKEKAMGEQRMARDEEAYVQAVVNSGGPDGDPPSLDLFPSVLEQKVKAMDGTLFQ